MARRSGWRTTSKDLQDMKQALSDAELAVGVATESMVEDYAFDRDVVEGLMPHVPDIDVSSVDSLHDEFQTRADFDRMKRYLGRISRASEEKPRRGAVQFTEDGGNLTTFHMDEDGNITESAFMRSEQRLQQANRNRRSIAELERKGVSMEQVPVMDLDEDGNYKPRRDEWGHVVKVWQPSTPKNQQMYQDIVDRQSELAVITPDKAVGGTVEVFGDMVPVTQRTLHRMTPKAMAESNLVDERTALRTENYFYNYQAIVETTLPDEIAGEFARYVNAVLKLPPAEQAAIYELISEYGEDAASIEYLYLDQSGIVPVKIQRIMSFWRTRIAPKVGVEVPDDAPELGELTEMLESAGYAPNSGQNIMGEYAKRRAAGMASIASFDSIRASLGIVSVPIPKDTGRDNKPLPKGRSKRRYRRDRRRRR